MSEQTQRESSPLVSERGSTIIGESVVSTLANRAASKVEGIHLSGESGSGGGLMGRMRDLSRGIAVEVGRTEVALDLTMGIDYGRDIRQTVEEVRRSISEEVEGVTGLKVRELNATISDIVVPETREGSQDLQPQATQEDYESWTRAQPAAERAGDEETTETNAGERREG